ncbi:MAG: Rne/Rng family ribonuclease, partial [Deltaproteobacteria bacterium]|nr:Rne/Rng family ribonuclease [Deltaproteobacteria bacterium]
DYFQDMADDERALDKLVKRGQELMVQVTKDPFMKKGAMLTTHISLPGGYMVLRPGSSNVGVSRKIENEEERLRLKEVVGNLKIPEDFGIIIRTAAAKASKTVLSKDLNYLFRLWKNIKGSVMKKKSPALLCKERHLVLRSIRDSFTPEVTEILIDDETTYKEVSDFIKLFSRGRDKIVKHYTGAKPIFSKFQLEDQIASIFESRVGLKSGGTLVIEQTEALVTIDVNSGKSTQEKSIEQTAYQTNLEAAEEGARQLRLRDLGGLIVIDFIDMRDPKHRADVERKLKLHVKEDKARTKVGKISRFGLLEMSRQRIRPSIEFGSHLPCKYCQGKGLVPSAETLGIGFLRKLSLETLKQKSKRVRGIVPLDVAEYLLNRKRREIVDLEVRRDLIVEIEGARSMVPGDSDIIWRQ